MSAQTCWIYSGHTTSTTFNCRPGSHRVCVWNYQQGIELLCCFFFAHFELCTLKVCVRLFWLCTSLLLPDGKDESKSCGWWGHQFQINLVLYNHHHVSVLPEYRTGLTAEGERTKRKKQNHLLILFKVFLIILNWKLEQTEKRNMYETVDHNNFEIAAFENLGNSTVLLKPDPLCNGKNFPFQVGISAWLCVLTNIYLGHWCLFGAPDWTGDRGHCEPCITLYPLGEAPHWKVKISGWRHHVSVYTHQIKPRGQYFSHVNTGIATMWLSCTVIYWKLILYT